MNKKVKWGLIIVIGLGLIGWGIYSQRPRINEELETLRGCPKNELFLKLAHLIDLHIHRNYRLYPGNYIACDLLEGKHEFAGQYTKEDQMKFEAYLQKKLDMIDLPDKDIPFLRQCILTMYANPAINHLKALEA